MGNTLGLHVNAALKKYMLLFLAALILGTVAGVILFNLPSAPLQKIYQKKPKVEVKTTYKNPFDKKTQYVNPFEKYKNPFVANR